MLATLYVAKKYIVPHLARACVNFLETSLTAKNACLLLSQSRLFEEPELMQRCWEVIDAQVCDSTANLEIVDRNSTHYVANNPTNTSTVPPPPAATPGANFCAIVTNRTSGESVVPATSNPQPPAYLRRLLSPTTTGGGSTSGVERNSSSSSISSSISSSSLSAADESERSGEPSV